MEAESGGRRRRSFTREYKAEVVELCRTSGQTIAAVARELGLTETAVRRWVAQAEIDAGRRDGLTTVEREELSRLRKGWNRMPKFTKLDPNDVQIGRGRSAHEARQSYRDALTSGDAGRIQLDRGDVASTVKRHLSLAAQDVGTKVRSSWEDPRQRVLLWKKVAA